MKARRKNRRNFGTSKGGGTMTDNLKTPRQLKSEQTKRTILDAAASIIREHGVEYVTVSNVCKAAGVSVGSFYHHFGDKEELLCRYLDGAFNSRRAQFEAIAGEDVVANVLEFYRLYHLFLLEQGLEFVKSYYVATNSGIYSYMSYLRGPRSSSPLFQTIDRLLRQAKEEGWLAEDCQPDRLQYELSLLEKGVIFDWCLCDGFYDLIQQSSILMSRYLRWAVSEKYLRKFGWRPAPDPLR